MLKRFSVENFKNFEKKVILDLASPANYTFGKSLIKDNCITKAMIYGINSSGKSNLGLALLDIVCHLTDKQKLQNSYKNYSNMNNTDTVVSFEYVFEFDGVEVIYRYGKTQVMDLEYEHLLINNEEMIYYDRSKQKAYTKLKGSETLNSAISSNNPISRVRYVNANAILEKTQENLAFKSFMDFVDRMLLFYSLDRRGYQGFQTGGGSIAEGIIKSGKLKDFESFLNENGIFYKLEAGQTNGEDTIYCKFKNSSADFFQIASTGTNSLALLYYWYINMEQASLVFMDEFDAFYHFELARSIVKRVLQLSDTQIILTTHNTDLISNDILRPDCYFQLKDGNLRVFSECTDKELRQAHNLQKMYKAGAFDRK